MKSFKNIKGKRMTLLTMILCIFLIFSVTGCESKKNEFTIRVFDSGINVEKKEYERYYYDYTGVPVSFVIKVYCNDEEIYETTLKYLLKNQGVGSLIRVRTTYTEFFNGESENGRKLPIEKGWYSYYIEFNRMYNWDGEIIQEHNLNDFYLSFYIDYDHYISTKEE